MPWLVPFASWGGAAFLVVFGSLSFYQSYRPKKALVETQGEVTSSFKKAALMTLAFGLLNPHVYLDTVILLGGIAASYAFELRMFFVGWSGFIVFFMVLLNCLWGTNFNAAVTASGRGSDSGFYCG